MIAPWTENYDKPRQHIKKQRGHFANKGLYSQSYGFSSSQVLLSELDHKDNWVQKNWCFWTVVLRKLLDCKEIKPVNPKRNQLWIFIGRTVAEAETQYFSHVMRRANSLERTLILGKTKGKRRRELQRMRWFESITDAIDMNLSNFVLDIVEGKGSWRATMHGVAELDMA